MSTDFQLKARTRSRSIWFASLALAAAIAGAFLVSDCGGRRNNNESAATGSATPAVGSTTPAEPVLAATTVTAVAATSPLPTPLYGVTIDDISELSSIIDSLQRLARKPTARIVFDETMGPSYLSLIHI